MRSSIPGAMIRELPGKMPAQLEAVRARARRYHRRVTIPLTASIVAAVLLASGSAMFLAVGCERALGLSELACRDARQVPVYICACLSLSVLLIVLPTQVRAVDMACGALVLNSCAICLSFAVDVVQSLRRQRFAAGVCMRSDSPEPTSCACAALTLTHLVNWFLISLWTIGAFGSLLGRRLSGRQRLDAMWFFLGVCDLLSAVPVPLVVFGLKLALGCSGGMLLLGAEVLTASALGFVLTRPNVRARAHAFLSSRSEGAAAVSGIASMMSGQSTDALQARAIRLFRGVRLDRVTYNDMFDDTRGAALNALAEPRHFLEVDAFVSHSWSDPPALKWSALQAWRARFVEERGREPIAFIDKYCISQTDASTIDSELACLPLWLAGCTELVVLFGPEYLSRTWCLMEIHAWLEMASADDNLALLPFGALPADVRVDVATSACSSAAHLESMLSVVEASAGGAESFDRKVEALLSRFMEARSAEPRARDGRAAPPTRKLSNLSAARAAAVGSSGARPPREVDVRTKSPGPPQRSTLLTAARDLAERFRRLRRPTACRSNAPSAPSSHGHERAHHGGRRGSRLAAARSLPDAASVRAAPALAGSEERGMSMC